jgi:hypothetical protein
VIISGPCWPVYAVACVFQLLSYPILETLWAAERFQIGRSLQVMQVMETPALHAI